MELKDYEKQEIDVVTRLRKIRIEKGLSQMELSLQAGISQNMIAYIEARKRNPTLSTLIKLCAALQINPTVLFAPEEEDKAKAREQIHKLIEQYLV